MSNGGSGAVDDVLVCNGVDAATGTYLLSDIRTSVVSKVALGEELDAVERAALLARYRRLQGGIDYRTIDNVDLRELRQTGWGVVFAHDAPPSVREALRPLLDHRRAQASATAEHLYREYAGPDGHRPKETASAFATRNGVPAGERANPNQMPYYLLIVGDPERIPYRVQFQLDVARAVGRIHFDTDDEYARYAEAVVASENGPVSPRTAAFFGTRNADDLATRKSADSLVVPLVEQVRQRMAGWDIRTVLAQDATKARLRSLVGGEDRPAMLFAAGHGVGFPNGDPRQLAHQGALLCQDWPGPVAWRQEIPQDFYLAAEDVEDAAQVGGMVAFLFACYGVGTPKHDDFVREATGTPVDIAPHAFVGRLPQRLLAHPGGGALAVVGHVERAWAYSFSWPGVPDPSDSFSDSVCRMMAGMPVGAAVEPFNERYATLATELENEKENVSFGEVPDAGKLSMYWTARNDARNYAIFGDPAVRLRVEPPGPQP